MMPNDGRPKPKPAHNAQKRLPGAQNQPPQPHALIVGQRRGARHTAGGYVSNVSQQRGVRHGDMHVAQPKPGASEARGVRERLFGSVPKGRPEHNESDVAPGIGLRKGLAIALRHVVPLLSANDARPDEQLLSRPLAAQTPGEHVKLQSAQDERTRRASDQRAGDQPNGGRHVNSGEPNAVPQKRVNDEHRAAKRAKRRKSESTDPVAESYLGPCLRGQDVSI